jgi:hypothetical protein
VEGTVDRLGTSPRRGGDVCTRTHLSAKFVAVRTAVFFLGRWLNWTTMISLREMLDPQLFSILKLDKFVLGGKTFFFFYLMTLHQVYGD